MTTIHARLIWRRTWEILRFPALVACIVAGATSSVAGAQSQPVVFQHGIRSDRETWQINSDALAQVFDIVPLRFTTGSQRPYEDQVSVLFGATAGLPDTTIFVAHSNGGIVSRQTNRLGRNMKGIVTVGTPHRGAMLAANTSDGAVGWYFSDLFSTLATPFNDYAGFLNAPEDPDHWFVYNAVTYAAGAFNLLSIVATALPVTAANAWSGLLTEMAPGSGFLEDRGSGLNGPSNLARESAALPNRVAIVSTLTSNTGVIFRAAVDAHRASQMVDLRNFFMSTFFLAFAHYYTYQNAVDEGTVPYDDLAFDKESYAYDWMDAAMALYYTDRSWCGLIGANDPYSGDCTPSDAVVPGSSQVYPNLTRLVTQSDVSHSEETGSATTLLSLRDIFHRLAISPKIVQGGGGGGGGGPITVSVHGPTTVASSASATWSAVMTGGQSPYTFVWSVDGLEIQRGATSSFTYANDGSNFAITLTVIDATGASGSSPFSVMVQACGDRVMC